jgi:hypothetical protein
MIIQHRVRVDKEKFMTVIIDDDLLVSSESFVGELV